jgi:hypothetical protein
MLASKFVPVMFPPGFASRYCVMQSRRDEHEDDWNGKVSLEKRDGWSKKRIWPNGMSPGHRCACANITGCPTIFQV